MPSKVRILPSPPICGNSSVGRAQAFQAWGRGFESRFPLHLEFVGGVRIDNASSTVGGGAVQSSVLFAQVAQSVEHVLGKDEVGGSIPLLGLFTSYGTGFWHR